MAYYQSYKSFFKVFFNTGDADQTDNSKNTNQTDVGTIIGIAKVKNKTNYICYQLVGHKKMSRTFKPRVNNIVK